MKDKPVDEEDILITNKLFERSPRPINLEAEVQVLRNLGRQLTKPPQERFQHFTTIAKDLCQAGTAGISLIETTPSGEEVFRWIGISGAWKAFEGGTSPRDDSLCGVSLQRESAQLYSHPQRYFTDLEGLEPPIVEALVVPLIQDGQGLGTIWVFSHEQQRQFDREDLEILTYLADFMVATLSSDRTRQAALEMSEERLRLAQKAAKAGLWDWDIVTNQVTWSEEYYQIYGLDPATTPSYKNWVASILEPDRERVESAARETLEDKIDLNVEFRVLHPIHGLRWIAAIGQTFYNADAQPIRMTGIALDITDRKQVEEALSDSEAKFQVLVSNIPGMVYRYHPCSGTVDQFTYVSLGARELFELEPESIFQDSSSFWTLIHPDDLSSLQESIELAVENLLPWKWEGRVILASGQIKWVQGRSRPQDTTQGTVWDGLLIDISDRKQAEAEREQLLAREQAARRQAETANRIKDEFLAVLSHELRSPLNPILGWTKLLQTRKFNEQETKRALDIIERNAKLQTQLIEDLLDVSRILRGKLGLNETHVDLVATIESAIETTRMAAEAKGIQIQTRLDSTTGRVLGDASRLQQIIWNLVSNAVKFTPQGGQVKVQLEKVGNHAQITVADTGRGINLEFLPYVFDYFRQEDSKTTRQFGGLGLGLAIVRYLTEMHGGTVQAESLGEGLGATFTVQLPLLNKIEAEVRSEETTLERKDLELETPLLGIRVLVIDDEADARELATVILAQAGAIVTSVASAKEGLQVMESLSIDAIVSDIGMPEMDGYTLLRQIRSPRSAAGELPVQAKKQIPAIALSAYAGQYDQQQAIAAGFQRHMAKPVDPNELVKAIVQLTRQAKSGN